MVKKRLLSIITILVLLITFIPVAAFAQETVTLNAISNKIPGDSVTISGTTTLGEVTIKVIRPDNTILYVDVAAASNGAYTKTFKLPGGAVTGTYTVVVGQGNVVATGTFTVQSGSLSSNADLSNLVLSSGTLSPAFSAANTSYTASVGNGVSSITVTPTKAEANATIKVNGTAVSSGQASGAINLNVGSNTVTVQVTAQNGTTKNYTITITRAAAVNVSSNNPVVAITTEPKTITVPAGVTDAKIEVAPNTVGNSKEVTLPLVEVSVNSSYGAIGVVIPAGTKITAPLNWDGTINVPTVKPNNSVTVTADSGNTATVNVVIEVGFGDVPLTFDKAVRLVIPGQAGKDAGYYRGTTFTKITTVLGADTQAAGDALPAGGDGKIDVGSDLVIWTKHFTKFIAYTQTAIPSGGGGGGGGGTMPAAGETITPGGGTVTKSGVTITFAASTVSSDIKVKVEKVTDAISLPLPANSKLVSDVLEITKDKSGNFAKPVKITLAFDKSKVDSDKYNVSIYWFDENAKKWIELQNIKADLTAGTVSGEVNHFTKFAVIATEKAIEKPTVILKDISGHWAQNNINRLVNSGAISGYPDGAFKPDSQITRAEFATVLVKAFKLQQQSGKVFSDTAGHWAKDYIATASAYGIVNGYDAATFGPNDLITREQMAVMIVKAAKIKMEKEGSISFADSASISDWAMSAVATATKIGIMKGYPDNTVKPKGNATRAEAVTVIVNALK
jgi:hypothetical protein